MRGAGRDGRYHRGSGRNYGSGNPFTGTTIYTVHLGSTTGTSNKFMAGGTSTFHGRLVLAAVAGSSGSNGGSGKSGGFGISYGSGRPFTATTCNGVTIFTV